MAEWKDPVTLVIWIGVSILILLVLVSFLVLIVQRYVKSIRIADQERTDMAIQYQKELVSNGMETQEKERARIASDLHDDLISQLHRLKIMNKDEGVNHMLSESISTARRISHDLSPPMLDELSLMELLLDFIGPFRNKFEFRVYHQDRSEMSLESWEKLHLFRIFMELMSNIVKHSKATIVTINLRVSSKCIFLLVEDNGVGISEAHAGGLGLGNIELRTQLLQGRSVYKNVAPHGTKFCIGTKREVV